MPEDDSGNSVQGDVNQNDPNTEFIDPPTPPSRPYSQNTKAVSEQRMESEIHGLEDRIRGAEKWMIVLTGGIVFLTAGMVIVGILQWNAMRG